MAKVAKLLSGKGIESLSIEDAPISEPGPGEALVRHHAATLNFRDLIMAKGLIPGIRLGHNLTAFRGGLRLWNIEDVPTLAADGGSAPPRLASDWRMI